MSSVPGSTPPPSVPAVEKRQYRNNTLGWLGVVTLGPTGIPTGVSVEPQGSVWLSDAEAVLTARAPRLPKDNPFEEQTFSELDPSTGQQIQRKVRPLVPLDEARWVPQEDRYLPAAITGAQAAGIAADNATGDEPAHASANADPVALASAAILAQTDPSTVIPPVDATAATSPGSGAGIAQGTPVAQPAQAAAVPQATPPAPDQPPTAPPGGDPSEQSWTERPTNQPVVPGELQGAEATPEQLAVEAAAVQASTTVDPSATEETASAATPVGEETGSSVPPASAAPVGEFAAHEEPGSPEAAAQSTSPSE